MEDFQFYARKGQILAKPYIEGQELSDRVSVSKADRENGSPKPGDMIAMNPEDPGDQWLIAADFFAKHYEKV